jgi:hypothetical protein
VQKRRFAKIQQYSCANQSVSASSKALMLSILRFSIATSARSFVTSCELASELGGFGSAVKLRLAMVELEWA